MKFKTPQFWYKKNTLTQKILEPAALLYGLLQKQHDKKTRTNPYKSTAKVICIGNATAGGSGKTPTAIAIMELIKKHDLAQNPVFLTRGYGGKQNAPLLVKGDEPYEDIGDEALILKNHAPVIVSADRARGAQLAEEADFDLIIMDDGFQNNQLFKDLNILVINGEMGIGNGSLLPAGPLRSNLDNTFDKTDLCIFIGQDTSETRPLLPDSFAVFKAHIKPNITMNKDKSYLAFCGLAYPDKFFTFLKHDCAIKVDEIIAFPDHYPYSKKDIQNLTEKAKKSGLTLISTRKDLCRIHKEYDQIEVMDIELHIDDEASIIKKIRI